MVKMRINIDLCGPKAHIILLYVASPSGLEAVNSPSSDKKGFSHDPVKLPWANYPGHSHNNKAAIIIDNNG